jgi:hypothetical protein
VCVAGLNSQSLTFARQVLYHFSHFASTNLHLVEWVIVVFYGTGILGSIEKMNKLKANNKKNH